MAFGAVCPNFESAGGPAVFNMRTYVITENSVLETFAKLAGMFLVGFHIIRNDRNELLGNNKSTGLVKLSSPAPALYLCVGSLSDCW